MINAIISKRRQEYEAGHYFTVEKLNARAEFLAERADLYNSEPGFLARYYHSESLSLIGQSKLALEKIQTLLPLYQKVQGEEHPSFLRSRWLNAKITSTLGDDAKALLELEAILPIQIEKQTTEHRFVKETEALIST